MISNQQLSEVEREIKLSSISNIPLQLPPVYDASKATKKYFISSEKWKLRVCIFILLLFQNRFHIAHKKVH
jgi:hypothetical protein